MNPLPKQIISIIGFIFILLMIFYGSILPYQKSKIFINGMSLLQSGRIRNVNDFEKTILDIFKAKSPIGQEEIIRHFGSYFISLISQNKNKDFTNYLMDLIRPYYEQILNRGKGLSFNQDLYIFGNLNLVAYDQTKESKYLEEAEKYFMISYNLGSKRPQALYGLFDVCRFKNDMECMKKIGEEILSYWPNETEIKKFLE
ncbi:MAG: hypothetical protein RMK17_02485 [bacterium]|nr:hypothetical protein [bacterium]